MDELFENTSTEERNGILQILEQIELGTYHPEATATLDKKVTQLLEFFKKDEAEDKKPEDKSAEDKKAEDKSAEDKSADARASTELDKLD